jgi:hypothetical protein
LVSEDGPPRKLAHKRKRKQKFGKSLTDRTAFHIWSFGRCGFHSAGKLSAVSIFGHRRVCHSVLPKRAYKIVVDGIESHPFHPEIRRERTIGFWSIKRLILNAQVERHFPEKGTGKRL